MSYCIQQRASIELGATRFGRKFRVPYIARRHRPRLAASPAHVLATNNTARGRRRVSWQLKMFIETAGRANSLFFFLHLPIEDVGSSRPDPVEVPQSAKWSKIWRTKVVVLAEPTI
jgi:hypothetical protein